LFFFFFFFFVFFLIYLVVSAERAGYKTPVFATKLARTRTMLLKDITDTYFGK